MKKTFFIIYILAIFTCCDNSSKKDTQIVDSLDRLLSNYISQHEEDSIITLDFWKTENHIDLVVLHEPYYHKDMVDGCFEKQGKLIIFHSDYEGLLDSLIIQSDSNDKSLLSKYESWPKGVMYDGNYDASFYCVLSKDSIIPEDGFLHFYKQEAISTAGINSPALNKIINTELNSDCNLITSLYFGKIDNEVYLCVKSDRFYESKNLDGCLFRDGRMLTLHSINVLSNRDIIDTSFVKNNLSMLAKYKRKPEESIVKVKGRNNCYKIVSEDIIIPIKNNDDQLEHIICK